MGFETDKHPFFLEQKQFQSTDPRCLHRFPNPLLTEECYWALFYRPTFTLPTICWMYYYRMQINWVFLQKKKKHWRLYLIKRDSGVVQHSCITYRPLSRCSHVFQSVTVYWNITGRTDNWTTKQYVTSPRMGYHSFIFGWSWFEISISRSVIQRMLVPQIQQRQIISVSFPVFFSTNHSTILHAIEFNLRIVSLSTLWMNKDKTLMILNRKASSSIPDEVNF
jgi:hypothetical protein